MLGVYLEILDDALQRVVSAQGPGVLVMERRPVWFDGELRRIWVCWVPGMDAWSGRVGLAEDGCGGEEEGGDDDPVVA